jgi:hypothetical protein
MRSKPLINAEEQKKFLHQAQEFADQGAVLQMMECLFKSTLLEAFLNHFSNRYPSLYRDYVYDTIATATDEIVGIISGGKKIKQLHTYLWKTINNKLSKAVKKAEAVLSIEQDLVEIKDPEPITETQNLKRDEARAKAISIAEGLIPRLGMTNVQAVMKYILGALKNGAQDVPNSEIAEALNMTLVNVRVSVSRGFSRLSKIVKDEGILEKDYELPFLDEFEEYVNENDNGGPNVD